MGPLFMALAFFISFQKTSSGVPQWIGWLAALIFLLGGVAATGIAFGHPEISNLLGPMIIFAMAIIPTWIAFGPGPRHCSGGFSFLGLLFHQENTGDIECRIAFGFGALLLWGMLIAAAWYTLTHRKNP